MRTITVALVLWWLGPCYALAREHVVFFRSGDLREGLCAALRIQLVDVADVSCPAGPDEGDLSQRLAKAAGELNRRAARLGVLLEPDPSPTRLRMYLVGSRPDEAVISITDLEDQADPDIDRGLALKVRAALDTARSLDAVRAAQPPSSPEPSALVAFLPPPPKPAAPLSRPMGWSGLLGSAGGLSAGQHVRGEASLWLGARRAEARWALELTAGAHGLSEVTERGAFGRVDESEWGGGLGARVLYTLGRVELGGLAAASLLRAHARGAARGRSGSRRLLLPVLALGAEARVQVFSWVWLGLAARADLLPVKQQFALDDTVRLSLGRVRVAFPVSLLVRFPLELPP